MSEFIRIIYSLSARMLFRIPFFLLLNIAFIFIYAAIVGLGEEDYGVFFFSLFASSVVVELFRKNGAWYAFGVRPDRFALRDLTAGPAFCIISFAIIISAGLLLGGGLTAPELPSVGALTYFTILIFFASVSEELIFRGIIFQAFIERFNPYAVIFLSSMLFAIGHIANPNISVAAVANIFLANVLMSAMYFKTKSLIMPISFHFFWNLGQQLFLGSPVSGVQFGLIITRLDAGAGAFDLLIGGAFGVEEGLLTSVILLALLGLVIKRANVSPYMAARLFKRGYAESELLR